MQAESGLPAGPTNGSLALSSGSQAPRTGRGSGDNATGNGFRGNDRYGTGENGDVAGNLATTLDGPKQVNVAIFRCVGNLSKPLASQVLAAPADLQD
jgi:hypothetical protein